MGALQTSQHEHTAAHMLSLHDIPTDLQCTVLSLLSPHSLASCRAVDRWIHQIADKAKLWLSLRLPTKSRSHFVLMAKYVQSDVHHQYGHHQQELNLVVISACRKAGATTLCDAMKTPGFVSLPQHYSHLQGGQFANDITVRWARAAIDQVPARVVLKELRCTASETPFSAGIYSKPNTAVLLLIDLSGDLDQQMQGARARVRALQKHHEAILDTATLVVGTKSHSPDRTIHFKQAYDFAASFHLPYVECDAHDRTVQEPFCMGVAMAAGLNELYIPSDFEGDAHIESFKAQNLTAPAPHFICEMLQELKMRAEEVSS